MTSFWERQQSKSLSKKLYRSIQLCRCNPDYQIKYPNEFRDLNKYASINKLHPEAMKRINHEHEVRLKMSTMPTVIRPVRLNRNV